MSVCINANNLVEKFKYFMVIIDTVDKEILAADLLNSFLQFDF